MTAAEKIEAREFTYVQVFFPTTPDADFVDCKYFVVLEPLKSKAKPIALAFIRQTWGEPESVHLYPRNYIRKARQMLVWNPNLVIWP